MEGGYLYCDGSAPGEVAQGDRLQCPECDTILGSPVAFVDHSYEFHNRGGRRKPTKVLNICEHEKMLEEFLEELSKNDGTKPKAYGKKPEAGPARPSSSTVEIIDLTLSPPTPPPLKLLPPRRVILLDLNNEPEERIEIDLNVALNELGE